MTAEVLGTQGIKATIIQDSIHDEKRIITYELEYPRFIHAELMTHRMLSRNAASSRAIPVAAMHKHIDESPALPVFWGKNQSGMQAKEELIGIDKEVAQAYWNEAKNEALYWASKLNEVGLHKQIANRGTEAYQMMKTIVTATEWDNWFWLRDHEDAQPEIRTLAQCMRIAMEMSTPMPLKMGEWHVPYVTRARCRFDAMIQYFVDGQEISAEDAKMISASCCAQVSYRKSDDSLEKARAVFKRLIESEPVHASPVEHQATPMNRRSAIFDTNFRYWEPGITHMNNQGLYGSGNFYGWVQFRQLIPNQSK